LLDPSIELIGQLLIRHGNGRIAPRLFGQELLVDQLPESLHPKVVRIRDITLLGLPTDELVDLGLEHNLIPHNGGDAVHHLCVLSVDGGRSQAGEQKEYAEECACAVSKRGR
jgi:hypothetical protein